MNYEESLAWLAGLQGRGWRLGLDRMRSFVHAAGLDDVLGGPGSPIQYLHVAGTNGKGSVTAYLQSMLVAQGYKTGGYFSPYVVDPRERIQIGGELISEAEFALVATELREVAERFDQTEEGGVTEFEVKTAMGFLAWKRAGVEVVALEVGLGGRLDATNVVVSAACAIVSISLDHTSILGHTEAEIAREKAGIIKQGVPCVLGPLGDEARTAIEAIAHERGAPLIRFDREVTFRSEDGGANVRTPSTDSLRLRPGIQGQIQMWNACVAYATIEAGGFLRDRGIAAEAIAATRLPGRLQEMTYGERPVLLDGAHNPDSALALALYLVSPPWTAIVGMLQGHDPRAFFGSEGLGRAGIEKNGRRNRILAVPVDNPRSLPSDEVAAAALAEGYDAAAYDSLQSALDAASSDESRIVVTGSFYLVGEAVHLIRAQRRD